MYRLRRAAAVAVFALLAAFATQPASAEEPASDAEINQILTEVYSTHTVTDYQRSRILTREDVASTTVDPTSGTADYELPGYTADPNQVYTAPPVYGSPPFEAQAMTCRRVDRYIIYKTWLGSRLVDYHFYVHWCYDGYQVSKTPPSRGTWIKTYVCCVQNHGLVTNDAAPNWSGSRLYAWTVTMAGRWTQCTPDWPCDSGNPAVRFGLYYNGTYSYTILAR